MNDGHLKWITDFIWDVADDVLRDLSVRGKYRGVGLPMTDGLLAEVSETAGQ